MVADEEAHVSASLPQHQQQVTCLLGDPAPIGVGGDSGEMNPPGVEFDEEQHVQPREPDGVDGEEVACEMGPERSWKTLRSSCDACSGGVVLRSASTWVQLGLTDWCSTGSCGAAPRTARFLLPVPVSGCRPNCSASSRLGSGRQHGRNLVAVRRTAGVSYLVIGPLGCGDGGAPRGIRTPNRQIRRLVLYVRAVRLRAVCAAQVRGRIQLDRQSPVEYWLVDCHPDCHRSALRSDWTLSRPDCAHRSVHWRSSVTAEPSLGCGRR
jgi:hypothetical protein